MRISRFLKNVHWLIGHRLLSRRNVRAAWIQSDPKWKDKQPVLDLTEEEWEMWQATSK